MNRLFNMNKVGVGGVVMMLVIALAAIGLGIALWSKVLTINGIVRTGTVNAEFVRVFTDDDDFVDNPLKDSQDTGNCPILVGPEVPPAGFPDKRSLPGTSCDPAATGRDPKPHYDKDVARCDALFLPDPQDREPQPGSQRALVALTNVYPSYHCTAWFDIHNNGTIPVLLHSVNVQGAPGLPCQFGSRAYDLNGDTLPDVEICVSELTCTRDAAGNIRCDEPQIDPSNEFQFNLDIHILQTAPQGAFLTFGSSLCLHQWNEETGACPAPSLALCNGAKFDLCVDGDGVATPLRGAFAIPLGAPLSAWPTGFDPGDHGIDTFDNDLSDSWTDADDIHLEGISAACPTGIRNAIHELTADCITLDLNGSFAGGQPVNCDLEAGIDFNGAAAGGCDPLLSWHDVNGDLFYDDGEDIILDTNGNGTFD